MKLAGRAVRLGLTGLLVLGMAGCGDGRGAGGEGRILVLAAANLQHALPDIVEAFEAESGEEVEVVLGSTGNLTAQIEQGAPGDLFLAADEHSVDRLEEGGFTRPGQAVYATGRIVVTWRSGAEPITAFEQLGDARIEVLAIANPEHAPYGQAAREALIATGLWDRVQSRLVLGENVSQPYQFVATGNADAGITALGVVLSSPGVPYLLVDAGLHEPLRQAGVVLRDAERPDAARRLLDFIVGDRGQEILSAHGFEPPGD